MNRQITDTSYLPLPAPIAWVEPFGIINVNDLCIYTYIYSYTYVLIHITSRAICPHSMQICIPAHILVPMDKVSGGGGGGGETRDMCHTVQIPNLIIAHFLAAHLILCIAVIS